LLPQRTRPQGRVWRDRRIEVEHRRWRGGDRASGGRERRACRVTRAERVEANRWPLCGRDAVHRWRSGWCDVVGGGGMSNWIISQDDDGIAWLGFDKEGASTNVLSGAVMRELGERVTELEQMKPKA